MKIFKDPPYLFSSSSLNFYWSSTSTYRTFRRQEKKKIFSTVGLVANDVRWKIGFIDSALYMKNFLDIPPPLNRLNVISKVSTYSVLAIYTIPFFFPFLFLEIFLSLNVKKKHTFRSLPNFNLQVQISDHTTTTTNHIQKDLAVVPIPQWVQHIYNKHSKRQLK